MSDADQRLSSLWSAIQSATQPFTGEAQETEFTGHVTLARVNRLRRTEFEALALAVRKFDTGAFGQWTANQIELMRSELLPQGAHHSLLAALPLLGT